MSRTIEKLQIGALCALALVLVTGCGRVDTGAAQLVETNVAYANASDNQRVDIYWPHGNGPFPVLFAIHGGGFMSGSRTSGDVKVIIESGLANGYAVVAVGYRLSGEATFPAAIDDVQAAIRFVRLAYHDRRLDTERFAIWGGSAGGNLAALAAMKGDAGTATHVHAAVDWFGPIRFDTMDAQFAALGIEPRLGATASPGSPESRYLGAVVGSGEATELVNAASPQTYISADAPPFLIQHGTADRHIPVSQSVVFAEALAAVLGPDNVVLELLEDAGHGGREFESAENLARVFAFLDAHLR